MIRRGRASNGDPETSACTIFNNALELRDPTQQARYLKEACAGDDSLQARVTKLLQAHGEAGGFFARPLKARARDVADGARTSAILEQPGDTIGRYKLLEQIGEGGCGVVYMAEQVEPVRRRVALKVIKLGMDTRNVVARFEAERQALALMDHPNIARVLDAGSTGSGRPFFVMELVHGEKITDFCDSKQLSTRERLELFILVCQAIQHAHQKGIIHRDLKPSNILVTTVDGSPVPKVIDFGVAKATDNQRLTDKTVFTAFEQFIGTPAYMSPEQADMSGVDIDTRTDVYSLGVVLYELLTGATPFNPETLRLSGIDGIRDTIRHQQPRKPSTRLHALTQHDLSIRAQARRTDANRLIQSVRGDLDWTAMKCLEKDRIRRYGTTNDLAMDIRRYLEGEMVSARPPTAAYRIGKFVRRNKVMVSAVTLVAAALVAGLAISTHMFRREQAARRLAGAAEAAERQQNAQAVRARTKAEQERKQAQGLRYCSDMDLAWRALRENNLAAVNALLEVQVPRPGDHDFREWEWRYLWQSCRGDQLLTLGPLAAEVIGLALLPDGRLLTGETQLGGVKLWDRQPTQVTRCNLQDLNISDLAVSPDGRKLAIANWSDTVRFLHIESLQVVATLTHTHAINKIAFSSDGHWLSAAGSEDVSLWEVRTGRRRWTRPSFAGGLNHAPFSPDAKWLVQPVEGGCLELLDVKDGTVLRRLDGFGYGGVELAVSPDGRRLAKARWNGHIRLIDLSSQDTKVLTGHTRAVRVLAFSPDSQQLASAGNDGLVKLWDVKSGHETASFRGHQKLISSLLYSPDGQRLFTGAKDSTVRAWPVQPKLSPASSVGPPRFFSRALSRDGRFLAAYDTNGLWCVVNLETRSETPRVKIPGEFSSLAIGQEGSEIALAMTNGAVIVWNFTDGKPSWSFQAHSNIVDVLEFSADWTQLATAGRGGVVRVWNRGASRPRVDHRLGPAGTRVWALAFTPNGESLIANGGGYTYILNLQPRGQDTKIVCEPVYSFGLSTDGSLLAVGLDEAVQIREFPSFRPLKTLGISQGNFRSVAFSPNGRRVIASAAGATWLWDLDSGREVGRLIGESARFQSGTDNLVILKSDGTCETLRAPSWAEILHDSETHAKGLNP